MRKNEGAFFTIFNHGSKRFYFQIDVNETDTNYIFEKIMSMKNGQCDYGQDEALKCGNKSFIHDDNSKFTTQINIIDLKEREFILLSDGIYRGTSYTVK